MSGVGEDTDEADGGGLAHLTPVRGEFDEAAAARAPIHEVVSFKDAKRALNGVHADLIFGRQLPGSRQPLPRRPLPRLDLAAELDCEILRQSLGHLFRPRAL